MKQVCRPEGFSGPECVPSVACRDFDMLCEMFSCVTSVNDMALWELWQCVSNIPWTTVRAVDRLLNADTERLPDLYLHITNTMSRRCGICGRRLCLLEGTTAPKSAYPSALADCHICPAGSVTSPDLQNLATWAMDLGSAIAEEETQLKAVLADSLRRQKVSGFNLNAHLKEDSVGMLELPRHLAIPVSALTPTHVL